VLINCTNVDDIVTVDLADDGLTIAVTLNGVTNTRNVGSETSVRVSGFFGNDTINVVDMEGLDLEVRGGDGNDTVTIGSGNGTSFDFQASTLTGEAGNDTLVFHDVELPTGLVGIERFDYEFGGGTVVAVHELAGTTTVPHQYAFESVRIDSGNAFSTFEITSLGSEGTLTLNGGAGADTLRLRPFATSATPAAPQPRDHRRYGRLRGRRRHLHARRGHVRRRGIRPAPVRQRGRRVAAHAQWRRRR
jgi:Ca2+-binding RTX toxin-like protein